MKHVLIALLLVFAMFANFRATSPQLGEDLIIFTKFVNHDNKKIDDASLRLYLYDQDLILGRNFDILKNSDTQFITSYSTDSLEPGEYILRATVNSKDFKQKTRHTMFVIS